MGFGLLISEFDLFDVFIIYEVHHIVFVVSCFLVSGHFMVGGVVPPRVLSQESRVHNMQLFALILSSLLLSPF